MPVIPPPNREGSPQQNPSTPVARNPFVRAANETRQPFSDRSALLATTGTQVGPVDVAAMGFMRYIVINVAATGGIGAATFAADGPFNSLTNVSLEDVNGRPIFGPLDGYDVYLTNKWGGLGVSQGVYDPKLKPSYTANTTNGNFSFVYRIPVEITSRDAMGSLPNLTASSTYKLKYTIAPSTSVYTAAPATLPTVRVRCTLEAWSQPRDTDPRGVPNETTPPMVGTTQFWSKTTFNISAGEQRVPFTRMGNLLRNLIVIFRNAGTTRDSANYPDPIRWEWDNKILDSFSQTLWADQMYERYGQSPDTGVFVYDFVHDADGRPGNENRHGYLPTVQGTRLETIGTYGAAGVLTILTNDITPSAGVQLDSGMPGN